MNARRDLWTLLMVATLAAAGCRSLSEVNADDPEPAYLGELSGHYEVMLGVPKASPILGYAPVDADLIIVHLAGLETGVDEVMGGIIKADDATQEPLFFTGTYADGIATAEDSLGVAVTGERVAGGDALRVDVQYQVCAAGPIYPLVAYKSCDFDEATSGLYRGETDGCAASAGEERALALGFSPPWIFGAAYPNTSQLMVGLFDPFEEYGCGFAIDFAEEDPAATGRYFDLDLEETDDELRASVTMMTPSTVWDPELAACAEGDCAEEMSLSRLSGGERSFCLGLTNGSRRSLVVTAGRGEWAGQRILGFLAAPTGNPDVILDVSRANFDIFVRAPHLDDTWLTAVPVPAGEPYSGMVEIPDVPAGQTYTYEIFPVLFGDPDPPFCFPDDGGLDI